jgi:hypothetical protein
MGVLSFSTVGRAQGRCGDRAAVYLFDEKKTAVTEFYVRASDLMHSR